MRANLEKILMFHYKIMLLFAFLPKKQPHLLLRAVQVQKRFQAKKKSIFN